MKILFAHNTYQQAGGEDSVLASEMTLLSEKGNDVFLASMGNESLVTFPAEVKSFLNVNYSVQSREWFLKKIEQHKPDLVHVHNFFPLLTPSIYDACIDKGIPVVQTLHNYRTICPGALLMRDGDICEKCITGSPFNAVIHRCYRDSTVGSFAVARMVDHHRKKKTWGSKVNNFIALTEFAKKKFIAAGFPEDKIRVKPNFVSDPQHEVGTTGRLGNVHPTREGALFVGRLSKEKGVSTLLEAWRDLEAPLRVAGTGPLESMLASENQGQIQYLGELDQPSVQKEMSRASFLVMPSEWYEGFPMVLVESFSQGLPIIASRLGGMAEIIEDGVTGRHFEAGNTEDLVEKVRWMNSHPEECKRMGLNARKVYEEKYTPEKNYDILTDIYQQVIDSNSSSLSCS
jgi:glycosyltransferase involved in cell wall biosynthesis